MVHIEFFVIKLTDYILSIKITLQLQLFFSKEPMIKLKAKSNQKILTNMTMCLGAQVIKPC